MEARMNWLVRMYPLSWRKRYGRELELLVEEMPGKAGVALDLLVGAAIAYRDVIGANRVLSAAGAYLHGLCVAVLLQAIVFVSVVLAGQRSTTPSDLRIGPINFVTVQAPAFFGRELRSLSADVWVQKVAVPIATEILLLAALVGTLAVVVAIPRMLRTLR
jgi:hypothetical protein